MPEPRPIQAAGRSQAERQLEDQMKQVMNTQQMIEASFFRNLENSGVDLPAGGVGPVEDAGAGIRPPSNYERAIEKLAGLRDDLAQSFINLSQDPAMSTWVRTAIRRVEDTITDMGGFVEPLNELAYMSNLNKLAGDANTVILANANRVVENTVKNWKQSDTCKIGGIKAGLLNGRPSIAIRVEGQDRGRNFTSYGRISAPEDFSGNESIDYARQAGYEVFTVRAAQLGHWKDVSERYEIAAVLDPGDNAGRQEQPAVAPVIETVDEGLK